MKILEKDLEEIIYTADKELLAERGLHISGKLLRQFKIGNYGVADLVEYQRPYYHTGALQFVKGTITVYELKQDKIGISAFLQAVRYLKGIFRFLSKRGVEYNYNYRIVLIGKTIDLSSSYVYLSDFLNFYEETEITFDSFSNFSIDNYTYDFNVNGITFNIERDYYLTEEGF